MILSYTSRDSNELEGAFVDVIKQHEKVELTGTNTAPKIVRVGNNFDVKFNDGIIRFLISLSSTCIMKCFTILIEERLSKCTKQQKKSTYKKCFITFLSREFIDLLNRIVEKHIRSKNRIESYYHLISIVISK